MDRRETNLSQWGSQMEQMLHGKPGLGTRCMDSSIHTIEYATPLTVHNYDDHYVVAFRQFAFVLCRLCSRKDIRCSHTLLLFSWLSLLKLLEVCLDPSNEF